MISLVLPAYNEEACIEKNLMLLLKEMRKLGEKFEIVIVEESSDRTPEIVGVLSRRFKEIKHVHFNRRLGKGGAVVKGIMLARGERLFFMDADLAVGLSAIKPLLDELRFHDVVIGSRYHKKSKTTRTALRLFLGRAYAVLPRLALGVRVGDFQCGFKGFRKVAARKLAGCAKSSGVFWDTEVLYCAGKYGFDVKEIPIRWEEKKGRSTKISMKTIFYMGSKLLVLFLRSRLLGR